MGPILAAQGALWHPQMGLLKVLCGTPGVTIWNLSGASWHPQMGPLKVLCGTPRWDHLEPHKALYGTPISDLLRCFVAPPNGTIWNLSGALWHPQMGPLKAPCGNPRWDHFEPPKALYVTPRCNLSRCLMAPPDGTIWNLTWRYMAPHI